MCCFGKCGRHIGNGFLYLAVLFTIMSCSPSVPEDCLAIGRMAETEPDLDGVVLPPNIAPINFKVLDKGEDYIVRVYSGNGDQIIYDGRVTDFDIDDWHGLLDNAKGDIIYTDIYVKNDGKWGKYVTRKNYVAADSIDPYITYRMIRPSYVEYEEMTINERSMESFDERVVYDNRLMSGVGGKGQCINCHTPRNYNRNGQTLFHVRQNKGGTVLIDNDKVTKVDLKTANTLSAGVYPAWNPKSDVIAFSVNETGQIFHTRDKQKIEVLDFVSSLVLYDPKSNVVSCIGQNDGGDFDTFPAWSPDGKTLYYCSARYERKTKDITEELYDNYQSLKYDIYSRAYDPETGKFGACDTVFAASVIGKSATMPRVSPDGRWLLFSMGDYGQFHIWHKSSDLYVMDLNNGEVYPLSEANSGETEAYHSWSSNGRWILFSSRRSDGNYTRLYLSWFDSSGHAHKPFILPQKNPGYYQNLFKSYNVPEWLVSPVRPTVMDLYDAIDKDAVKALDSL